MRTDLNIILICFILIISTTLLLAQEKKELSSENQLLFYTDVAAFRNFNNDSLTYQEIYISFPNYQLSYIKQSGLYLAAYKISILLSGENGDTVVQKEWENFNQINYLKEAENLTSLEIAGLLVAPGDYSLSIELRDLNANSIGLNQIQITIPTFEPDKLQISEVQFAQAIKNIETKSKFVKNNIEVLPNPSRVFGIESPFIFFYAEIYTSAQAENKPDEIKKEFAVIDSRGKIIKSSTKTIQPKSTATVWVEKINILDVVSGRYNLKLKVTDEFTGNVAEQEAELWINNPYKTISLSQYDENDLKEFRSQIEYIVDRNELEFFDQLNTEGKIQYINDFWRSKTPEFRAEHLKRFYLAQKRFASPTFPGWKSDRGRVYIMYGPPDEIEREPASVDTRAYEIWVYETLEKQGYVEFVFVDLGVVGNYKLVHSTLKSGQRAEIYNPNWMNDFRIAR